MTSPYKSLDSSSTQIRLLRLLPLRRTSGDSISGEPAQPWHACTKIECTLVTVALEAALAYDALSYAWGCEDPEVQITIDGATRLARSNLAYALAALRGPESRLLWIDALCIDQDSVHERNHQVRLMGEVYRQARQVLVWLGRPGSQFGSLVAGAVKLLERLGDFPPQSSLPSRPPEPDIPHEDHFERWIKNLRRGDEEQDLPSDPKEKQRKVKWWRIPWSTMKTDGELRRYRTSPPKRKVEHPWLNMKEVRELREQRDSPTNSKEMEWVAERQWFNMKADRELRQRRRQRIPEMLNELEGPNLFLIQKQQELRDLQALQSRQQKDLEALQSQEKEELRKLDEPLYRVLLQFKARQAKALEGARSLWQYRPQERKKPDDAGLPEQRDLGDQGQRSGQDPQAVESIHRQISEDLRNLQEYIENRRQELEKEKKWSLRDLTDEWKKLEKLQRLDEDERRKLGKLESQLAGWLRLENNQGEALRQLGELQDMDFESGMRAWDQAIENALRKFGSRQDFEPDQCEALQHLTQHQLQSLERLRARHESQWAKSLTIKLNIKPSLTANELGILRQSKVQRRQVHQQLLALRNTEIQRRAVSRLLEQYPKWTERVYQIEREIPTVAHDALKTREDLLNAQATWVHEWHKMSIEESKEWQDRILGSTDAAYEPWDVQLLSLTDVCDLPYWSRLWIVQEVLLAKDLILCFGDDARTSKSWNVLTKARHSLDQRSVFWPCDPAISASLEMIKYSLPFQLDRLRERFGQGWPLHSLLEITENSQCQDPRDKVYGLLGLANDYEAGDIDINYSKPIEDVYQDTILWYHKVHGTQESSPSLVRFSQIIQMSFKTHSQTEAGRDSSALFRLAQPPSPLPTETFFVEAIFKGTVLPIEKYLQEGQLIGLRQQDWVNIMLDYLVPDNQFPGRRAAVEKELIYLDSIITTLAMPISSPVSATDRTLSLESEDQRAQQLAFNKPQGKQEEQNFFVTADGEFGIASTRIREDDDLYRFKDSQFGLILRRSGSHYALVSKAILSHAATDVPIRSLPHQRTPHRLPTPLTENVQPAPKEATQPAIRVTFDAATLQQLTMPFDLSDKHKSREPLYIDEANFGWYEFMTLGLDVSPSGLAQKREPNLFTVEASNGIKRKDVTSGRDARRKVRVGNVSGEGFCAADWRQHEESGLGVHLELGDVWKLNRPMLIWAH